MEHHVYISAAVTFSIDDDDCPQLPCLSEGETGRKRLEIKERKTREELRRQARIFSYVSFIQGCGMRGKGENMDGGVGLSSTRRVEGTGD